MSSESPSEPNTEHSTDPIPAVSAGNGSPLNPPSVSLPDDDLARHDTGDLPGAGAGAGAMGTALAPVLRDICDGRLDEIRWFRTDWQRGGALTGYSFFTDEQGAAREVVVKLPVPPCERHWLVALQSAGNVVPVVYAHGEAVGGYDLAWVVMERLPYGPLGQAWGGQAFDMLIEALGRFYHASRALPLKGEPLQKDWPRILEMSRKAVRERSLAEAQRWNAALKKAQKKLKQWQSIWEDRPTEDWCHGDVHLGNAMTRQPPDSPPSQAAAKASDSSKAGAPGEALLLDFAETRVGHWVQDAVYFEHLYWARRDRLEGRKLVKLIAQQRKARGLPTGEDWPRLAEIKRALLALSTPAQLRHNGDPAHVAAALAVLEGAVG